MNSSDKKSKVDRVAILLLTVSSTFRIKWLLSTSESEPERQEVLTDLRTAWDEMENGSQPKICVETGCVDRWPGETLNKFRRAAQSLSPRQQQNLCRVALNVIGDCPALVDFFNDELVILLKGQLKRKSEPKKWTSELIAEAQGFYHEFHHRTREARKFCNRNPQSTGESAASEDARLHPGRPTMPAAITAELQRRGSRALKSPAELAREWTAKELNRKHRGLRSTPDYLRRHVLNADIKADSNGKVEAGALQF